MNVLVACETSGRVRDAFAARGHRAVSCDLLDSRAPGLHLKCNVLEILDEGWDLLIAHPPCTYLARSGLHWNTKDPLRDDLTAAALEFVRELMRAPIAKIAIENPKGRIGTAIRPADQFIQPWQFGEDASKTTGLWLKNLLPLRPTKIIQPRWVCSVCAGVTFVQEIFRLGCSHCPAGEEQLLPRWANQADDGNNKLGETADRWQRRADTYPGIATAMAEQWGGST